MQQTTTNKGLRVKSSVKAGAVHSGSVQNHNQPVVRGRKA